MASSTRNAAGSAGSIPLFVLATQNPIEMEGLPVARGPRSTGLLLKLRVRSGVVQRTREPGHHGQ
jgi:hypothetical protein